MAQGRNIQSLDTVDSNRSAGGTLDSTKTAGSDAFHKDVSALTDRNYVSVSVYLKSKASDREIAF
jgi:hypothetical protein